MTRTYANAQQVIALARDYFLDGITSSKEVLELSGYKSEGYNYDYRQVDLVIMTLSLMDMGARNGTLKASKTNGLTLTKKTKA